MIRILLIINNPIKNPNLPIRYLRRNMINFNPAGMDLHSLVKATV